MSDSAALIALRAKYASLDERGRKILEAQALLARKNQIERAKHAAEGGLLHFVRYFWPVLEPMTPLVEGWPLAALCQHLEAVSRGLIPRLLINVCPGFMKSLLSNVFLPAWHWSAFEHPHSRFLAFSYAASLTERDNRKLLSLINSPRFQNLYGKKFKLAKAGESLITNDKTGFKLASSVGGVATGERGDVLTCDDPHAVRDAESDTVRNNTVTWFKETMQNRLNDPRKSAIIVIMQRVHSADVSGIIRAEYPNYEKLTIPMMYDGRDLVHGQKQKTSIGWSDPRTVDGEIAWPERYDLASLRPYMTQPFLWASQYQQTPEPRGGAIVKRDYWKKWVGKHYPPNIEYVLASADTAYTDKETNDPSALTIWGLFSIDGQPHLFLMHGWRKHLELHGPDTDRKPGEAETVWIDRTQVRWGLCEWIAYSCRRFKVHKLLIEGKASGLSVAQELKRLYRGAQWSLETVTPQGDKLARMHASVSTFTDGLVYAPVDKRYADLVISDCALFPKGQFRDIPDTVSQAIKHFRDNGLLLRRTEKVRYDEEERRTNYHPEPLYPV